MRVILRCQSEMSGTFCRIPRLFHGTQGQTTDQWPLPVNLQSLERSFCSSFGWISSSWTPLQSISEIADKVLQVPGFFHGSGCIVDHGIQTECSCQKYSDATVSFASQHKIFDKSLSLYLRSYGLISTGFPFSSRIIFALRKIKVD